MTTVRSSVSIFFTALLLTSATASAQLNDAVNLGIPGPLDPDLAGQVEIWVRVIEKQCQFVGGVPYRPAATHRNTVTVSCRTLQRVQQAAVWVADGDSVCSEVNGGRRCYRATRINHDGRLCTQPVDGPAVCLPLR